MWRWGLIVTSALVGVWGCSHERAAETATAQGSFAQPKDDFAAAYDAVNSGVKQTAMAGTLALRGVGKGVVEVTNRSKEALTRTGGKVGDAWITTKVKTELATTKGIKSGDVSVDTDAGIVRLSGIVDSSQTAERAIETALEVKGVEAVDSQLRYP